MTLGLPKPKLNYKQKVENRPDISLGDTRPKQLGQCKYNYNCYIYRELGLSQGKYNKWLASNLGFDNVCLSKTLTDWVRV